MEILLGPAGQRVGNIRCRCEFLPRGGKGMKRRPETNAIDNVWPIYFRKNTNRFGFEVYLTAYNCHNLDPLPRWGKVALRRVSCYRPLAPTEQGMLLRNIWIGKVARYIISTNAVFATVDWNLYILSRRVKDTVTTDLSISFARKDMIPILFGVHRYTMSNHHVSRVAPQLKNTRLCCRGCRR